MLACLLRLISLAALLAVAAGLGWLRDGPAWAFWLFFWAFPIVHASFLAIEFILAARVNARCGGPPVDALRWCAAWWREVGTSLRVFGWRQPWRSQAVPDALPGAPDGRTGVVFLHGYLCNRGLWADWMRELRAQGRACLAPNLEPVFGRIDDYVPIVEHAVVQMTVATGRPPVLVCHSMGGLAARAWLRAAGPDGLQRVQHIVTLGTPHGGTWLARFGLGRNTRQMRLDSRWLHELAASEPAALAGRLSCWWADCDNIVFPAGTAARPGAGAHRVPGVGHVHLVMDPAVRVAVLATLPDDSGSGIA